MEIVNADAHRALAYIAAATRNGHRLTRDELLAYIETSPEQAAVPLYALAALGVRRALVQLQGGALVNYMARVGWISDDPGFVTLTSLGGAMLRHAQDQAVEEETSLDVALTEELAYPRVIGLIARMGPAAVVDPYFRAADLISILHNTEVSRVLTSEKGDKARIPELSQTLGLSLPRPFEIRVTDDMHDRFVIADDGAVRSIGTSLSGVGRRFSVSQEVTSAALAQAIRDAFETSWSAAAPVVAPAAPPAPAATRATT